MKQRSRQKKKNLQVAEHRAFGTPNAPTSEEGPVE